MHIRSTRMLERKCCVNVVWCQVLCGCLARTERGEKTHAPGQWGSGGGGGEVVWNVYDCKGVVWQVHVGEAEGCVGPATGREERRIVYCWRKSAFDNRRMKAACVGLLLASAVIVDGAVLRRASPRQAVLKQMGESALRIVVPNRTNHTIVDVLEDNLREERQGNLLLQRKVDSMTKEVNSLLGRSEKEGKSSASNTTAAAGTPLHYDEDKKERIAILKQAVLPKMVPYATTASNDLAVQTPHELANEVKKQIKAQAKKNVPYHITRDSDASEIADNMEEEALKNVVPHDDYSKLEQKRKQKAVEAASPTGMPPPEKSPNGTAATNMSAPPQYSNGKKASPSPSLKDDVPDIVDAEEKAEQPEVEKADSSAAEQNQEVQTEDADQTANDANQEQSADDANQEQSTDDANQEQPADDANQEQPADDANQEQPAGGANQEQSADDASDATSAQDEEQ